MTILHAQPDLLEPAPAVGLRRDPRPPARSSGQDSPAAGAEGQQPSPSTSAVSVGVGKLAVSTLLPTPTGWTTMGRLAARDQLLDRDGRPCSVIRLSPVEQDADLYRVHLSDGQEVLADADHQWVVRDHRVRERAHGTGDRCSVSEHLDDLASLRSTAGRLGDRALRFGPDHRSSLEQLWELVADLQTWQGTCGLDAALRLTSWPGPGSAGHASTRRADLLPTRAALRSLAARLMQRHNSAGTTAHGDEVLSTLELVDRGSRAPRACHDLEVRRAPALDLPGTDLPLDPYALGHVPAERIPRAHLRASSADRLALLQGLMDSSGCLDASGRYELRLVGPGLAEDAGELVRSLGAVATVSADIRSARTHHVTFVTDLPVFRHARTLDAIVDQAPLHEGSGSLRVVAVEPVDSADDREPVRAIYVDSKDSTYLIAGMVAAHNAVFLRPGADTAATARAA